MPKKLILIFVLFFTTLGILTYVIFFLTQDNTKFQQLSTKKLIPIIHASASLSILPNPAISTSSANTYVNVEVETNSNPTDIQLELAFKPGDLYSLNISPGDYFINPEIPLEKIDYKNGRISYVVSGKSINPYSHTVARISFTPFNVGIVKKSGLQFMPKTSIKQNTKVIELKNTTDLDIIINPSFVPFASPSALPGPL